MSEPPAVYTVEPANGNAVAAFAYDDDKQSIVVEQRFSEAQTLMRQGLTNMIEAGGKFAEIRDLLRHNKAGGFDGWCTTKGLTRNTVYKLIHTHDAFATVTNLAQLDIVASAAFLLSAPSVPAEARAEAIQRAEQGERITVATAQAIVAEHMAEPDELKPAVLAWARAIAPTDPRGVLQQIVITNSPVGVSHFEALGDYLRQRGHRFMRAAARTAVQRCIEDLARPVPRVVAFDPPADQDDARGGAAGPKAKCTICGRPLSDPASIARGAGDVCSGSHDGKPGTTGGNGRVVTIGSTYSPTSTTADPGPQSEPPDVDLPAVVLAWLDEKVENLEMAGDTEARVLCLEQVIRARNGFGHPSGDAAWRSLRNLKDWPAWAENDTKIEAVRRALARLTGKEEAPEDQTEIREDETEPVAAGPRHSWDGVKPTGGNGKRPGMSINSDAYRTLLDRKTEHVERGIKAAVAFKKWVASHPHQLDEDADLAAVFALSEDFRIHAMCLD